MSTTHDSRWNQVQEQAVVSDDYLVERQSGPAQLGRIFGLIAGAVVTLIGVIALAKINWDNVQFDAPVVAFAGMTFTPIVAGITTLIGIILIGMASVREGDSRVAIGAVLATIGVGLVSATELQRSWTMTDRQGWLAIAVGVIFVLAGLLTQGRSFTSRRRSHVERGV